MIQIDTEELIKKIKLKREQRRESAERAIAQKQARNELKLIPYKNRELNSPVVNNPQLLKLKSGDQVTLKGIRIKMIRNVRLWYIKLILKSV